jgi:hypothetical protein
LSGLVGLDARLDFLTKALDAIGENADLFRHLEQASRAMGGSGTSGSRTLSASLAMLAMPSALTMPRWSCAPA